MNGWNKLSEEAVKVEAVRNLKGKLDSAWLAVFWEDRFRNMKLIKWFRGKHFINFFH